MIKAMWLTSDRLGCGTYRAYMPALSLQDSGVVDNEFIFHDQVNSIEKVTDDLDDVDVVIFQRAVGTMFLDIMKYCRAHQIATVFEFDDNVFDLPKHNPSAWFWRRKQIQRLFKQQLEFVDRVIVSTRPLREVTLAEMGWRDADQKIRVCMNHVHPAVWGRQVWGDVTPYQNKGLVIGWQGSSTHDTDFKMALPALWKILEEFQDITLRMFGSVPLSIKGVIPDHRFQWTKGVGFEQYPATLRFMNFDIGIAPITDSLFNRSKSNIKWLEYSALGIPSVCSRVYPYERSITEAQTGFLAETADEWYEKLRALVVDADLRQRIGAHAQRHVWQHWSHETHAPKWAEALTSVVTPKPSLSSLIGDPACTSSPTPMVSENPSTAKTDS